MTPDELRDTCLGFLGAVETYPFGDDSPAVFKVGGKMFALSFLGRRGPLSVSVKCEPLLAEQLRAAYPQVAPGYHLNKRHWNTVAINDGLADALVRDMIEDSYDLVVDGLPRAKRPKRQNAER